MMKLALERLRAGAVGPWLKWLAVPAVLVIAASTVIGQNPLPPTISLAAEPLYARGARAKPTLTLALSVEFPTVGAQYVGTPRATEDATYSPATEYVGYFDDESCYAYNDTPQVPAGGRGTAADYKRFDRIGDADRTGGVSLRTCNGRGFSGNFMNWAGSSAIDILRLGLSGGDRVVDTQSGLSALTVLQRAYLPSGFWNSSNFPSKKLLAALAPGAVPTALLKTSNGAVWTGNVFVASCANRIHFGTVAEGNCGSPGRNADLGATVGPIPANGPYSGPLPAGVTRVAGENGSFTTTTTQQVFYGAVTSYAVQTLPAGTIPCTNAKFGDPLSGTVKDCYVRDPVSSTGTPGLTSDGFYYSRVRVCESDASGVLTDPRTKLCLRYPNGGYKPVGNLQKYSDRLRVAAFGYMNDSRGNPDERYGGVMRAPMKYVGAKTFDANFSLQSGANPYQEWNDNTGELIVDPGVDEQHPFNKTPEGRSGVINYLNQFGRTGPSPGTYKTYDPVGELYYEALRYLQGLPPTAVALPKAADSATDVATWKDGFPIYDIWVDPHPPVANMSDYSCVRNNILAIGDVNTHNDKQIPGNTRNHDDAVRPAAPSANEPDFVYWTQLVGGFESNIGVGYTDSLNRPQTTGNYNPPNSARWGMENQSIGADDASYYMAGMAYWANTQDIRGAGWSDVGKQRKGMRVTTYVLDVNEFGDQTDPSAHRNNQFFLAAKYGGFKDTTLSGNPFRVLKPGSTIEAPVYDDSNVNWEAAPGTNEAKNYFLSSSAKGVLAALDDIFANVVKEANSIAGGAISTQRLTTASNLIYQAQFDPADWSGDVAALPVSADADGKVTIGDTALWNAADRLDNHLPPANRKIFIGPQDRVGNAVAFNWTSVDAAVQAALRTPPNGTGPTDPELVGQQRLDYLRGVRTLESAPGTFRKRGSVLGDIVNSGIAYSGPLPQKFNSSTYGSFYSDNVNRKNALFVGANDGMLHAFDAGSGDELFAYIPSWLTPKLSALTSPSYTHQSYVDGTPVVVEAKVGSDWKTVLVSGTGGGGQGVFALDVTRPEAFDASKVMWEFSDQDDASLGNVVGRPQILQMRTSTGGAPKYFAVIASGVNNYAADGRASADGRAAIFFLDLSKPRGSPWLENSNYFKVLLPAPLSSIANGVINFSPQFDSAGLVSVLYAGDLQGNLWKLDFARATAGTDDWNLLKLSPFLDTSGAPLPLFIARGGATSTSPRQPITMDPKLVTGPNRGTIVAFGTGKFLELSDTSGNYATQSVYAVLDDESATIDADQTDSAVAGRARLKAGGIENGKVVVDPFVWGRPTSDTDVTVRAGWYFDFANSAASGERQISGFAFADGTLVFGSVIPSVNSCDNGSGNVYIISVQYGSGTAEVSTVGILGEPLVTSVGEDVLGVVDTTGRSTQTIRYQVTDQGSSGIVAPPKQFFSVTNVTGRLSWRELSNYQSLRTAP